VSLALTSFPALEVRPALGRCPPSAGRPPGSTPAPACSAEPRAPALSSPSPLTAPARLSVGHGDRAWPRELRCRTSPNRSRGPECGAGSVATATSRRVAAVDGAAVVVVVVVVVVPATVPTEHVVRWGCEGPGESCAMGSGEYGRVWGEDGYSSPPKLAPCGDGTARGGRAPREGECRS
jgi:hypothetical protein